MAGDTWIAVAYVAGMFLVLSVRPQQIVFPASFRLSYIFFGLYLIVPGILHAIIWWTIIIGTSRSGPMMGGPAFILLQFSTLTGKVLLALSIVFALRSMINPWTSGWQYPWATGERPVGHEPKSGA
ncbi:MAG: hypothetical protein KatS3mg110_1849 [Pirellulaceae bacterium]|nr:MAG: hypothetical protein KatS3mg110_1849 [Pirellulaceae bacterium]